MNRSIKNMSAAVMAQVTNLLSGVIVQHYLLIEFGSTLNGLTSSVTQILSYLTLLEAGLNSASIQALYKPLAEKDDDQVSRIYVATGKQFAKIGGFFIGLLIILTFAMPGILRGQVPAVIVMSMTFMSGFGSALVYIFSSKCQALLYADKQIYIVQNTQSILTVIASVAKLLVIFCVPYSMYNIIYIGLINLIQPIIKVLVLNFYVSKHYKGRLNKKVEPDMMAISKRWSAFIHQVVGAIHNHADVLLLTIFSTLSYVSVYNVYNLIYSHINSLVQSVFSQAAMGSFGQLYAKEDKRFREYYDAYEFMYIVFLIALMTAVAVLTLPFISLYTAGVNDVEYIDKGIAVLFYLAITMSLIRVPAIMMVNIGGYFKETQKGAIIEAVINLSCSIPLLFKFGIRGILCGTVFAMIFRTIDIISFVYKNILHKKIWDMFYYLIPNFILSLCIVTICVIAHPIQVQSWIGWIAISIRVCLVIFMVYLVANILIFRKLSALSADFLKVALNTNRTRKRKRD